MSVSMRYASTVLYVTAVLCLPVVCGTPHYAFAQAEEVLLRVEGEIARPLTLSHAAFAQLPRTVVQVRDRDGTVSAYAGVLLRDILVLAGVPLGEQLRGDRLAMYVVVEASDKYRVIFALPELDAAFTDRVVLLADRRDNQPLPAAEGPLRLVIPDEKRHARWVRQVVSIYLRHAS
jgi:DMSO/TMAO reductase YedYZ molybdopterin-dependent catalytic subunit